MVYQKEVTDSANNQNAQVKTVFLFKSKKRYKKFQENSTMRFTAKEKLKEYANDYLTENLPVLDKCIIQLNYYTDDGIINSESVLYDSAKTNFSDIQKILLADPKTDRTLPSDETSNSLHHRLIKGISIFIVKPVFERPTSTKAKKKNIMAVSRD